MIQRHAQKRVLEGLTAGSTERYVHPTRGAKGAPIMVIFDPPNSEAHKGGLPSTMANIKMFAQLATAAGLGQPDFLFVGLCPPLPADSYSSASKKWKHVQQYAEGIHDLIAANGPKCIVTLGELATRAVMGRAVAITKARGTPVEHLGRMVLPMTSPGFVMKVPEHQPMFEADVHTLARLKRDNWQFRQDEQNIDYQWREDISDLLVNKPAMICVDTETTGLRWHDPNVQVITVQISVRSGQCYVIPLDIRYWPEWKGRMRQRAGLIGQLKTLLEDPMVRKVGHNLKFDKHMLRKLGIEMQGWSDDTQIMAFMVDENMLQKSLDECVRRWVPSMAGYADQFNATVDKSNMLSVPRDEMLAYAGGDGDAGLRLFQRLDALLRADKKQFRCYRYINMPAMNTFADVVERHGMLIDKERLRSFGLEVEIDTAENYDKLISTTPAAIRLRHLEAKQELSFSRTAFVRDILFDAEGFNLTPIVFTKTTKDLPEDQREPSTSAKDHLPFFTDRDDAAGEYVTLLMDYQKSTKLLGTYIGKEADGNGLWQYIAPNGRIYPSYKLHVTVTGRTASSDPNGQNFPKRGRWAKAYQSIFIPTPGYKLINCDLSQIELRIAAWMANDQAMLKIYREGGDIHTATAKIVSGLTDAQWDRLSKAEKKDLRTKAKAVNFGFLYGMGWRKFMNFARTDYGVKLTEREAQLYRTRFFATYKSLEGWHVRMRNMVDQQGMVRALHGAARHLPSIYSNDPITKSGAERQAINSPVQRFGSDLGLMAMIRFSRQADPDKFRIIGFVHDALVMEVKDGYEHEGLSALLWCMENNPLQEWFGITPPLPIKAEADIGLNGGNMLELADLPPVEKRPDWFNALGFDSVEVSRPEWWSDHVDNDFVEEVRRYAQAVEIT